MKFYRSSIISGADQIIFLPDQNGDACALVTRNKINIDSLPKATTIAIKRELEAWILADSHCIRCALVSNYHTSGITDNIIDAKETLYSIVNRNLGFRPTSVEAANIFANHFSIEKAASVNTSAKRLVDLVNSFLIT